MTQLAGTDLQETHALLSQIKELLYNDTALQLTRSGGHPHLIKALFLQDNTRSPPTPFVQQTFRLHCCFLLHPLLHPHCCFLLHRLLCCFLLHPLLHPLHDQVGDELHHNLPYSLHDVNSVINCITICLETSVQIPSANLAMHKVLVWTTS